MGKVQYYDATIKKYFAVGRRVSLLKKKRVKGVRSLFVHFFFEIYRWIISNIFGKVIVLICLPARASAMAMLVLPSLRLDLSAIKCKFKEERKKSLSLFLPNEGVIAVYERSKMTDLWTKSESICESSEIFCHVKATTSILTLKILVSVLENYSNDLHPIEKYTAELLAEYDDNSGLTKFCDQLQDGIWESAFNLQRLLKKLIAKKRWKVIRTFGRVIRNYQQFMEDYYAPSVEIKPGGKGYVSAMQSFNYKFEVVVSFPFPFDF